MTALALTKGKLHTLIDRQQVMSEFCGFSPFNFLVNMSGQTSASIPCGFSEGVVLNGLHMIAYRGQEALVLQAAAYEDAHPLGGQTPTGVLIRRQRP